MKEYWGEGSNRARNWQRYDLGGEQEAVLRGGRGLLRSLRRLLCRTTSSMTLSKVRSTMCNCGALTIPRAAGEGEADARVRYRRIVEGGAHDVVLKGARFHQQIIRERRRF